MLLLFWIGKLSVQQYILAFLMAGALGDLALALGFEAMAPTKVTVRPGERFHNNSPLRDRAKVVSAFSAEGVGKVSVRGEVWNARCVNLAMKVPAPGEEVSIAGRDGLTLLVEESRGQ